MSIVRDNLLSRLGYTPYCGAERCRGRWPRTQFSGRQFICTSCGWSSNFEPSFINEYKKFNKGTKGPWVDEHGNKRSD